MGTIYLVIHIYTPHIRIASGIFARVTLVV